MNEKEIRELFCAHEKLNLIVYFKRKVSTVLFSKDVEVHDGKLVLRFSCEEFLVSCSLQAYEYLLDREDVENIEVDAVCDACIDHL